VVLDLPTYPYEKEFTGINAKMLLAVDRINRRSLKGSVDLILHYGLEKELFGIPCLNVSNGVLSFPSVARSVQKDKETLHLLAVGKWAYWHGLDRIVEGVKGSEEVTLHIVGVGPESKALKKNCEGKANVIFHGNLSGEKLEKQYQEADIGIGTLGIHRKGLKIDSSLKHREYCMRGLPFILSTEDLDFPEELAFVKYFSRDDEAF